MTAGAVVVSVVLVAFSWRCMRAAAEDRRDVANLLDAVEQVEMRVEAMLVDFAISRTVAARESELYDQFRQMDRRSRHHVLRRVQTLVRNLEAER
jgi:outer membrane murein-binding lipoprotein Lpp